MSAGAVTLLLAAAGGAAAARALRLPMWALTGAIVGSALASVDMASTPTLPGGLTFSAQVLVGTAVGAAVRPTFLAELRALLTPALLIASVMVSIGLSAAGLAAGLRLLDPEVALMGMLPGGVGEMVAASAALGTDPALVAGIHLTRLLISLWALPVIVRWAVTWDSPTPD